MLEIRITVLHDRPASDSLKEHATHGYYLFRDTQTKLYFLIEGVPSRFAPSPFWAGNDPILDLRYEFDTAPLEAFVAEHKDLIEGKYIDPMIAREAVALSEKFSTRVLCAYANDEDDDFAVTAENGNLLRLRFKAGSRRGKRVDDAVAKDVQTEFKAVRIHPETDEPDRDGVYEFTAFEAIQTVDDPLSLHPYWHYLEGEINRDVIFRTITSEPEGATPNLLFRNAHLEFEEAFGQPSPDFTCAADPDRFEQIDHLLSPTPAKLSLALKSLARFPAFILASPKRMLWTTAILFVLAAAIFGDSEDRTRTQIAFADDCASANGNVGGDDLNLCIIGDTVYRYWNLPGEKDERRSMALVIGEKMVSCANSSSNMCLSVNGHPFESKIDGFNFIEGQVQILFVERLQLCSPQTNDNCSSASEMFQFKKRIDRND